MATKIGQLARELSRQNPWWRSVGWAAADPDLAEARQSNLYYRSGVLDNLGVGSLYILRGPRRVGKTVAVKQAIEDLLAEGVPPTCIIRIAADGWSAKDLRTVTQNAAIPPIPAGAHRYWFFDEISAVTGAWDQQIKWLRDNDTDFRNSTVILTGSNASALTDAAGLLAGRRGRDGSLERTLFPMGFRTFTRMVLSNAPELDSLAPSDLHSPIARERYFAALPWLDELTRTWELYLQYGGFPRSVAAALAGEVVPHAFAEDLFHVISADAFKNSRLTVNAEMALLERLWAGMGSPANLTSIAEHMDISNDAVVRHIEYLRDAFLLWECRQRAESAWLPRQKSQAKLYATDPLIARLAHLRNASRADVDITILTEMQLGMALRRSVLSRLPTGGNDDFLFYVRTPTRKEIDFVAEPLGAAIEGKYIDGGNWRSEAATVNASPWKGLFATRTVLDVKEAEKTWAVPAAILSYLLDT